MAHDSWATLSTTTHAEIWSTESIPRHSLTSYKGKLTKHLTNRKIDNKILPPHKYSDRKSSQSPQNRGMDNQFYKLSNTGAPKSITSLYKQRHKATTTTTMSTYVYNDFRQNEILLITEVNGPANFILHL